MANIKMILRAIDNFKALMVHKCLDLTFDDQDASVASPLQDVGVAFQFINEIHLHYLHPTLEQVMQRDDDGDHQSSIERVQQVGQAYAECMLAILHALHARDPRLLTLPFMYAFMQYQHTMVGIKPYLNQLLNEDRRKHASAAAPSSPRLFKDGFPNSPASVLQVNRQAAVLTSMAMAHYRQPWPKIRFARGFDYVDKALCIDMLKMLISDRKNLSANLPHLRQLIKLIRTNQLQFSQVEYQDIVCAPTIEHGFLQTLSLTDDDDNTITGLAKTVEALDDFPGHKLENLSPLQLVKAYLGEIKFWYKQKQNRLNKIMARLTQDEKAELIVYFIQQAKGATTPESVAMLWNIILRHYPKFSPQPVWIAEILNHTASLEGIGESIKEHFQEQVSTCLNEKRKIVMKDADIEDRVLEVDDFTDSAEMLLAALKTAAAGQYALSLIDSEAKKHKLAAVKCQLVTNNLDNLTRQDRSAIYQRRETVIALAAIGNVNINRWLVDQAPEDLVKSMGAANAILFMFELGLLSQARLSQYTLFCDSQDIKTLINEGSAALLKVFAENQAMRDLLLLTLSLEEILQLAYTEECSLALMRHVVLAKVQQALKQKTGITKHQEALSTFIQQVPDVMFIFAPHLREQLIRQLSDESFNELLTSAPSVGSEEETILSEILHHPLSPWRHYTDEQLRALLSSPIVASSTIQSALAKAVLEAQLTPAKPNFDNIRCFWTDTFAASDKIDCHVKVNLMHALIDFTMSANDSLTLSRLLSQNNKKNLQVKDVLAPLLRQHCDLETAVALISSTSADSLPRIDHIFKICHDNNVVDDETLLMECWKKCRDILQTTKLPEQREQIKAVMQHLAAQAPFKEPDSLIAFIHDIYPNIPADILEQLCQCQLPVSAIEAIFSRDEVDEDDVMTVDAMKVLMKATQPPERGWFPFLRQQILSDGNDKLPEERKYFYYRMLLECPENNHEDKLLVRVSLEELESFQCLANSPELDESNPMYPVASFFQTGPEQHCVEGDTIIISHAWYIAARQINEITTAACQLARRSGGIFMFFGDTVPNTGIVSLFSFNKGNIESAFIDAELEQVNQVLATYESSRPQLEVSVDDEIAAPQQQVVAM